LEQLREKQDKNPYVFASQYQQNPIPSGGALFKPDWFIILDETPEILATFITADTAETDKSYNDATAFSFWGLYVINTFSNNNTLYGLHWLDSVELRIEPRELEAEFYSFYSDCMLFSVKPKFAAIEQKSTGVTLISTLKDMRGLQIKEVKRTKASGSKTQRFLEMQPIIASKQISFTKNARHVDMCINHMIKITANNAHKHDDLADNCYDAIKIALIDKLVINQVEQTDYSALAKNLTSLHNKQNRSRQKAYSK
jgi:predicted phage terminase large subunit-like protein